MTLVFDATPQGKRWTVLTIGAVQGERVLLPAGIVKPQPEARTRRRWPRGIGGIDRELGADIIDHVAAMSRDRGRRNARLDCALSSQRLIALYERYGFVSTGTVFLGGMMMHLMERAM